ncbi:MAG: 16S rRNA processing protein RimM [Flavobacteriales bacterium]|nr:16S rRNA processing protein RimM [Flavobacteriales bacterium]
MKKEDCFELGHITKPRSFKGEVIIYLDTDSLEEYLEMESVFVEINQQLVPFFIEDIRPHKSNNIRVKFEGIDSESDAKALVKKKLFLPLTLLPELDTQDFYHHEVIGFNVEDKQHGDIGVIADIVESNTNPIFKIEHPSGQEILIPVADNFIEKVNKEEKRIFVNCPEGLIELYLS